MEDTFARTPDYSTFDECLEMGCCVSPIIGQIENECGHAVLIAFLLRWGGLEFHITKTPSGDDAAFKPVTEWLRQDIGYGRWMVPRGLVSDRIVTRWRILSRLRAGQSLSQVARGVGCTIRAVSVRKAELIERGLLPAPAKATLKDLTR